jgi:hypothetical protein
MNIPNPFSVWMSSTLSNILRYSEHLLEFNLEYLPLIVHLLYLSMHVSVNYTAILLRGLSRCLSTPLRLRLSRSHFLAFLKPRCN